MALIFTRSACAIRWIKYSRLGKKSHLHLIVNKSLVHTNLQARCAGIDAHQLQYGVYWVYGYGRG